MSLALDVINGLVRPREILARRISPWVSERDRLLWLYLGCVLAWISVLPWLAREAYLRGDDLSVLVQASALAWLMLAPILLVLVAALIGMIAWLIRKPLPLGGARSALFWGFLNSSPLLLLFGMVRGLNGDGLSSQLVGFIWLFCFLRIFFMGLLSVYRLDTEAAPMEL